MGHLPKIPSTSSSIRTELFGTFLLVLIGTSALTAINVAGQATTASTILVATMAFSAAIGWLTYSFYRFPLPQFNPAVTILFWTQGILPLRRSIVIIMAQLVGAIAASVAVALLYGSAGVEVRLGAVYPATSMGSWAALIAEIIGSGIALYAVQIAINRQRPAFFNPFLLIGMGYGLGYLMAVGISGGSLNPARALAPQLAAADLTGWWAYLAGPIVAALGVGYLNRQPNLSPIIDAEDSQHNSTPGSSLATAESTLQSGTPQTQSYPADIESEEPIANQEQTQTLQEKAQEATTKLKDNLQRPHLPFTLSKPSFYPLKGETLKSRADNAGTDDNQPTPPHSADKSSANPASSESKPAVKFVDFERSAIENSEES